MATKATGNKEKFLHVRLTEEDETVLLQLTELYQIKRTALVSFALRHILETCPTFEIRPTK